MGRLMRIWLVVALSLFGLPFYVLSAAPALAATCPPLLPVKNSWENTTFPAGVDRIYDSIGGSKQINYGFGPSQLTGEPSFTYQGTYYEHFHLGIDTNHIYETIYAPYSGTAYQYVGGSWGTGPGGPNQVIVLKLDNGARMIFMHLSEMIASGRVRAGDVLGVTGNTGYSTGPHLHVEVRDANGNVVPPERWLCTLGSLSGTSGTPQTAADMQYDSYGASWSWNITNDNITVSGLTPSNHSEKILDLGSNPSIGFTISASPPSNALYGVLVSYDPVARTGYAVCIRDIGVGPVIYYSPTRVVGCNSNFTNYVSSGSGSGAYPLGTKVQVRWSETGTSYDILVNGQVAKTVPISGQQFTKAAWSVGTLSNYSAGNVTIGYPVISGGGVGTVTDDGGPQVDDPGNSVISFLNPIKWLWDKLKGVLVPSETQLDDLRSELTQFMSKEPMGTVADLVNLARDVKSGVAQIEDDDGFEAISGSITSASCTSILCGSISISDLLSSVASFLDSLASWLDSVSLGPITMLGLMQAFSSFCIVLGVYRYIKARIIVTA